MGSTRKIFESLALKKTIEEGRLNKIRSEEAKLKRQEQIFNESRSATPEGNYDPWKLRNGDNHTQKINLGLDNCRQRKAELDQSKQATQQRFQIFSQQVQSLAKQQQKQMLRKSVVLEQKETDEIKSRSSIF